MNIEFSGTIIYWRGPAPFYFVAVPKEQSKDIKSISHLVTYGWGTIPVTVTIEDTEFTTAIFPKDEQYLVPIKKTVREAEFLDKGDTVKVLLKIKVNLM